MSATERLIARVRSFVERGERISTDDAISMLELSNLIDFATVARVPRERRFGRDAYYHAKPAGTPDADTVFDSRTFLRVSSQAHVDRLREIADRRDPVGPILVDTALLIAANVESKACLEMLSRISNTVVCDGDCVGACNDPNWIDAWSRVHRDAHELGIPTIASLVYGVDDEPAAHACRLEQIRHLQDDGGNVVGALLVPAVIQTPTAHYRQAPTGLQTLRMCSVARIFLDNVPHIGVPVSRSGLEISVLALSYGADVLDRSLETRPVSLERRVDASGNQEISIPLADRFEAFDATSNADPYRENIVQRLTEGRWNRLPVDPAYSVRPDFAVA